MGNPPRVTLNGSQSARDQWLPIPLPHCTGAALYSIFKDMPTPKRRRNSTWPLETDTLESKGEGKLFNEDGSQWWLYISFLNSRHTALLQPVLTFVLSFSHEALRSLCALALVLVFLMPVFGRCVRLRVSVCLRFGEGVGGICCLLNVKICLRCGSCLVGWSTGKCWPFSSLPSGHILPGLATLWGLLWNDVLYQHWMSQTQHHYCRIASPQTAWRGRDSDGLFCFVLFLFFFVIWTFFLQHMLSLREIRDQCWSLILKLCAAHTAGLSINISPCCGQNTVHW